MSLLETSSWTDSVFTGKWSPSAGGTSPVVEPATGQELGRVGLANTQDVTDACTAAAAVQAEWAATPFEERARVLRVAGQLFEEHADEIGRWIMRETGAISGKAGLETHIAAQECFEASALASRPLGSILPTMKPRLSLARRVPVGVVGVISPFNFPLILSIRSVAPALALGNSVVLKPDLRTAVSGGVVIARVLEAAGLPAGVLQMLPGGIEAGEALVADRHTRVISFTGSTAAGRRVGEAAGRLLKRAHLELGGNNALIVLPDVDLDKAVSAAAFGSFMHQGQICMTTGRHIVHESIADDYVERLARIATNVPVGDPAAGEVALGPVIDAGQRDKVHDIVTRSVDAGARLAAGGTYDALFYQPTVLDAVEAQMPAWAEEIFGPVAPVARFSTVDEAAQIASSTDYGLSLGILTHDVGAGMALADRIHTGIVHINDQTVDDEAVAPFGGVGDSGTGSRFGGAEANLEAFTETRWYTVQSEIPAYPF